MAEHRVVIIGSGPAGLTAALYTARANLKPLLIEGLEAGGQLMLTTMVENWPGFRDGIMGPDLMAEMRAQAERFGAEMVPDDVVAVDLTGEVKVVTDGAGTRHRARAVILSTGSGYRKLGIEGEDRLSGHGVSWCASCDGFFFRDQHIAVVGGGDSAIEEATFLTRFGSKVSLIHRRDELRASKIMQERAFADPKLEIIWDSEVAAINGDERLESITLRSTTDGSESTLPVTGVHAGTMDLRHIDLPEGAAFYLCGPLPFMRAVRSALLDRGVLPRDIQYEVFGPDLWQADLATEPTPGAVAHAAAR